MDIDAGAEILGPISIGNIIVMARTRSYFLMYPMVAWQIHVPDLIRPRKM